VETKTVRIPLGSKDNISEIKKQVVLALWKDDWKISQSYYEDINGTRNLCVLAYRYLPEPQPEL
jgi:hypothetical protein